MFSYDAFYGFPGNPIKSRDKRYGRYIPVSVVYRTGYADLQVGEATPIGHISRAWV
jgi:hypothetical protein